MSTVATPHGFDCLSLRDGLLARLAAMDFQHMTPIQQAALPAILAGQDVIAKASTGSGKTVAFALGCLQRLDSKAYHVQSLLLCPTRELAEQVASTLRNLAKGLANTKVLSLCGGVSIGPQVGSLQHSAHLIVGTPGRVLKHLRKGTLHVHGLDVLVLDEADRMLDMGFAEEISALLEFLPSPRQNLMFSATYGTSVQAIAERLSPNAVSIDVTQREPAPVIDEYWCAVGEATDKRGRLDLLLQGIAALGTEANLVFCNTKAGCIELANFFAAQGVPAAVLHGDLEQADRQQMLICFSNGSARILVATDVAARGLDIDSVGAVFNADLPQRADVYTHRIGRTGRSGRAGLALSLVGDREMHRLRLIEEARAGVAMQLWQPSSPSPEALALLQPEYQTIEINGGRRHKLRPGDILGALTAGKRLPGSAVGNIHILDQISYVAVLREKVSVAVKQLDRGRIKARPFRARLVGAEHR